jgi:hypothetical protein
MVMVCIFLLFGKFPGRDPYICEKQRQQLSQRTHPIHSKFVCRQNNTGRKRLYTNDVTRRQGNVRRFCKALSVFGNKINQNKSFGDLKNLNTNL